MSASAAAFHRSKRLDNSNSSRRLGLDDSYSSRSSANLNASNQSKQRSKTSSNYDGRSSSSNRSNPQNPQNDAKAARGDRDRNTRNSRQNKTSQDEDSFRNNDASGANIPPSFPSWLPAWIQPVDELRRSMGRFINSDNVQYFVLTLITINAIMMGVATFSFVKDDPQTSQVFEVIDQVFLIIFTIESGLQLLYHGWYIFQDGFLVFDMLIVILSWALQGTGTQVFRAFRIFRALRLVTRIETMRNLLSAMFDVMPKLGGIFALLALVFYIFGVMFTNLYKDLSKTGDDPMGYFSTLPRTLFTLFQIMCLDEWASVYDTVSEFFWWSWMPFIAFIFITAFVVINLVVAVICDVVSDLDKEEQAGLYGFESDEEFEMARKRGVEDKASKKEAIEKRMKELQQQIETMVNVQDQMRLTTMLLTKKLRDNSRLAQDEE